MKALALGAVALLLVVGQAGAQSLAQTPDIHQRLAGFGGDPEALPHAITALERHGGRVVKIRFTSLRGRPAYDAIVAQGGGVRFVRLTQAGGAVRILKRSEAPRWMLSWRARRDLSRAAHADVGLATAVRMAESESAGAAAVAAGIATLASDPVRPAPAYNVLLMRPDGSLERVAVDARTGLAVAKLRSFAASSATTAEGKRPAVRTALEW
jgi:hypothetical protein